MAGVEHVAEGAAAVGDADAAEEAGEGAHGYEGADVGSEGGGDLEESEDGEAAEVHYSSAEGLAERCLHIVRG